MWDPVLDRLADERDVIAIDMPGFGDSPPLVAPARRHDAPAWHEDTLVPDGRVTPRALARAVHAHLLALGIDRRTSRATRSAAGWRWNSRSPVMPAR